MAVDGEDDGAGAEHTASSSAGPSSLPQDAGAGTEHAVSSSAGPSSSPQDAGTGRIPSPSTSGAGRRSPTTSGAVRMPSPPTSGAGHLPALPTATTPLSITVEDQASQVHGPTPAIGLIPPTPESSQEQAAYAMQTLVPPSINRKALNDGMPPPPLPTRTSPPAAASSSTASLPVPAPPTCASSTPSPPITSPSSIPPPTSAPPTAQAAAAATQEVDMLKVPGAKKKRTKRAPSPATRRSPRSAPKSPADEGTPVTSDVDADGDVATPPTS